MLKDLIGGQLNHRIPNILNSRLALGNTSSPEALELMISGVSTSPEPQSLPVQPSQPFRLREPHPG